MGDICRWAHRERPALPIPRSYPPMEARLVDELPTGARWQYEPRWDGFRCLVYRGRLRHETSFLRWRPDKLPTRCTIAQVEQEGQSALTLLPRTR